MDITLVSNLLKWLQHLRYFIPPFLASNIGLYPQSCCSETSCSINNVLPHELDNLGLIYVPQVEAYFVFHKGDMFLWTY